MSDIDTVNNFNAVSSVLPYVQGFIGVVQASRITIDTDGNGHYWASVVQYSSDTGQQLANAIIPLNITSGLSVAATVLGTLQTLIASATVVQNPPSGAIPS